jgi:hypothetical protein
LLLLYIIYVSILHKMDKHYNTDIATEFWLHLAAEGLLFFCVYRRLITIAVRQWVERGRLIYVLL